MANTTKKNTTRKKAKPEGIEVEASSVVVEDVSVDETSVSGELNTVLDSVDTNEVSTLSAKSLQHFPAEQQAQIVALSEAIDVSKTDKVMTYGQAPLIKIFDSADKILKDAQGTTADQKVIEQVRELAKQASDTYEDFALSLKEPNFFEKALLKLSKRANEKHASDVNVKAISNYKVLQQLRNSCDEWVAMLTKAQASIEQSGQIDLATCEELEQYIVAGRIAEERIAKQVEEAKLQAELTGLLADKQKYEELKEGFETFKIVLFNLEKSRAASGVSIGQLQLQLRTNKNIQVAVRTQQVNSMAVATQQIRNAVLDQQNRTVLEGQKSIAKLNDALLKKISENAVLTAEESEQILISGMYTVEAAMEAAKTVIEGCDNIQKSRADLDNQLSEGISSLKSLVAEISPYVESIEDRAKKTGAKTVTTHSPGQLTF